jgi:Mrr restriction endonuclease-like protein
MINIEVSDKTYRRLFDFAESFDDSPELVINRLLDQMDPDPSRARNRKRSRKSTPAPRGSLLPERDYWVPILEILAGGEGGAVPAGDVIDILGEDIADRLKPADKQRLDTGETRWKNRARFARLRMKELGLLDSSERGIWKITDAGRQFLESHEESGGEVPGGAADDAPVSSA